MGAKKRESKGGNNRPRATINLHVDPSIKRDFLLLVAEAETRPGQLFSAWVREHFEGVTFYRRGRGVQPGQPDAAA